MPADLAGDAQRGLVAFLQRAHQGAVAAVGIAGAERLERPVRRTRQGQRDRLGPGRIVAGELAQPLAQRARHPGQRARVVGVLHQQVQQRRHLAAGLELRAVGDGRVEQAQQQREAVVQVMQPGLEAGLQRLRQHVQPLDLARDTEQAPAVVAGHAVGLRAGDRRQMQRGLVEHAQHIAERLVALACADAGELAREQLAQVLDQAPVLGREPLAQRLGALAQRLQVVGHAEAAAGVAERMHQCALEHPRCLRRALHRQRHRRADHALPDQQPVQHLQHRRAARGQRLQRQPRQPHAVLGPLGVAAEPEQVLRRAAGDHPTPAGQVGRVERARQQRGGVDLAVGQHPGVGAGRAGLHRQVGVDAAASPGHPGQAAGQHLPAAGAVRHRVDPHHHRARLEPAGMPDRQLGGTRGHHQRVRGAVGVDACLPLAQRLRRELAGHHRREAARHRAGREGRHDQVVAQPRAGRLPDAGLAAPPAGVRRQLQGLAQQPVGDAGPEGTQARALEHAGAGRVGQHQLAGAHRLHQAGHAQRRVRAQLQRVEPLVVDPAQQHMHLLQPAERLQIEPVAAHRQVRALHQRDAEVAGQEDMLEVGLVARPRRQQRDARVRPGRAVAQQALDHRAEGRGHPLHLQRAEGLGKLLADDQPVLQQIAQARGRLGALADHPPAAVGRARQVEGHHMQPAVARRAHAVHRPQVLRMRQHQRGRQQAVMQQVLRAVEIGQRRVEQPRALAHAGLDVAPLVGRDQQRQQLQRPGACALAAFGIDVVGRAVLAHPALHPRQARGQIQPAGHAVGLEEAFPHRRQAGGGRRGSGSDEHPAQLVMMSGRSGQRRCGGQKGRPGRLVG